MQPQPNSAIVRSQTPWVQLGCVLLFAACLAPHENQADQTLPKNWETMGSAEFTSLVESLTDFQWGPQIQETLRASSLGFGEPALRATLLYTRQDSPQVSEHFVASLERRLIPPSRGESGNQITQAAALLLRPEPLTQDQRARLLDLAIGANPHPDLAVRVECAVTLLALGQTQVASFLIRVLRARTPAEASDPPDWPRLDTMAWVKHRAAGSLAQHLGVPNSFRPDGSWQHQIETAEQFEELLR